MSPWTGERYRTQHFTSLAGAAQIDLYEREGIRAWERINREWPLLRKSLLLRIEAIRVYMRHLRARCALAAVDQGADSTLLAAALRDARRLRRERAPWARPLSMLIRAAVRYRNGATREADALLQCAGHRFHEFDMQLFARSAYAQRERLGAGDGREDASSAWDWFRKQETREPQRMADLFVPGFRDG
jgi:hypothetical protein